MKAKIIGHVCATCGEMVELGNIASHPHKMLPQKNANVSVVASTPLSIDMEYHEAVAEITIEAAKGHDTWGAFNSAHEGFAVLLEEVEELKAHVWQKQRSRDLPAMKKEAMQVAAMALRFMIEVCDEERGRR